MKTNLCFKRLLLLAVIMGLALHSFAQQFKWAQSNGASALLSSNLYLSPTINPTTSNGVALNEMYVGFSGTVNHLIGAGNGVAPDIGLTESNSSKIARYDANMNLVWVGYTTGPVAADPRFNDQFYVGFSSTSASTTYGGIAITGQAAASSAYIAKCKATGSLGFTVLWVAKIDGTSDDAINQIKVKDIGGGNVRIAVTGISRSPTVSNYANGTNGIAQTAPINGGGGAVYDYFIAEYNDDGNAPTPLWINTFGNSVLSESGTMPFELNDAGDVIFAAVYSSNSLGTANYTLNNAVGSPSPGTLTTLNYSANVNGARFLLFKFDKTTGSQSVIRNEFGSTTNFSPQAITSDASRTLYVYGQLTNSYTPAAGVAITSAGNYDAAVLVLDEFGTPLRAQRYGGAGDDRSSGNYANAFSLDRANNRLYMSGRSNTSSGFNAGTATVQFSSGYTGFVIAASSVGTMQGISAINTLSNVSGATQEFRSVSVRPDGKAVGGQQYTVTGYNRLNSSTTNLFPKTAFGYTDIAITRFDSSLASLLNPELESLGGSSTGNSITGSATKGSKLLLAGTYNGTMTVGSSTISGSGMLLVESDTASGVISQVKAVLGSSVTTADIRISPIDGSIYICGGTLSDLTPGTALGKTTKGSRDAYIMKLDASYNHLWTAFIGGVESDNATGLTVDATTGDVYVTGPFNSPNLFLNAAGGTTWSASTIANNSNSGLPISSDVYVAKFHNNGTMQWIVAGGSSSNVTNDNVLKGVVYSNGAVYVGAVTPTNSTFNWGATAINNASSGSASTTDMVLLKLDPGTGTAIWSKAWDGNNTDVLSSLAAGNGKIYVAGYSISASGMSFGSTPFITSNNNDAFVFAIDPNGVEYPLFTQLKGNSSDIISEIKTDAIGNIFFAGQSSSSSLPVAGSTLSTAGSNDLLLGSIDPESMMPKFGFMSGSVQSEGANTISPGSVGMSFVGGNLLGTATFGSQVLNGRLGGDFVYARVDYPFQAPGAQLSNLNAWFKSNALLNGSPATSWANSSANSSLTTLIKSGTLVVNPAAANFNPSLSISGSANYMNQSGIFASNFTDGTGTKYSIYTVYKPSALTDKLALWGETSSGTNISMGASSSAVTGSGGTKVVSKTTPTPSGIFSLDVLILNGGAMNSFYNGKANGSQSGATAVNVSNAGSFQMNGTGNFEVAEVVVYGGSHTQGQATMNQINSYFGIKYGITLSQHYFDTVGDTVFKVDGAGSLYLYDNNIAGIAIDSNEVLVQKQSRSQNVASKGNMLTIGLGSVAADNASNLTPAGSGISYVVWGDNGSSVSTTQNSDMAPMVSSCAYRLPRAWKINRTGFGIGGTQVLLDMSSTISMTGYAVSDFQLMIDLDGDGNFSTGTSKLVNASGLSGSVISFDNVLWDSDNNGSDVFTLLINNKIPNGALVANNVTKANLPFTCPDVSGALVFVDSAITPTEKYLTVSPMANTGYNFSGTALNNNPTINNHRVNDGSNSSSVLGNRMYKITDAGTNNYPSGMKLRVYYSPSDSISAVSALSPTVSGPASYGWYKLPASTVSDVVAAQTAYTITGATALLPSAYGVENGVNYVEFGNVHNFGLVASMALKTSSTLPVTLLDFSGVSHSCTALITWTTASEYNVSGFEVERSKDGVNFEEVGTVMPTNTMSANTYFWRSPQSFPNEYYRLRTFDVDGRVTFSKIISLHSNNCGGMQWKMLDNPLSRTNNVSLRVHTEEESVVEVIVQDLLGQTVLRCKRRVLPGTAKIDMPYVSFHPGIYLLRVVDDRSQQVGETAKFTVF